MNHFKLLRQTLLVFTLLVGIACNDTDIVTPPTPPQDFISQTSPLTIEQSQRLDGVYAVDQGKDIFGDSVVIAQSGNRVTLYSGVKSGYVVFQVGSLDSVILMVGYWKYQNSEETGLAQAYIKREEGAAWIVGNGQGTPPSERVIRLSIGEQNSAPSKPLRLRFVRPFSEKAQFDRENFYIIGHRCAGRMSDGIPASENTIELALRAEELGCNSLEVDVRKSKDGVLYLYHDATINPRLIRKNTLVGATEDYTWSVLQSEVTLLHGEKMPTLEDFLTAVIEKTNIKFVYLDTKTVGDGIIADMVPIQKRALEKAASLGRDIDIYIGIPNTDLLEELKTVQTTTGVVPSLIETSPEDCIAVDGKVWSPRWSDGTQSSKVQELQGQGRYAVTWTIDMPVYIQQYLNEPTGRFNGFLTNYPMLVKYYILMQ